MTTSIILKEKHSLDSVIESLATVEALIDKICMDHKIQDEVSGNIFVAVTEAVNNAIKHGNKQDPKKKIFMEYTLSEMEFNVRVKDMGEGFNYKDIPDPTDPKNLYKPYGRGIFIMKNLCDEVHFEEKGSMVIMKFKFSSSSLQA